MRVQGDANTANTQLSRDYPGGSKNQLSIDFYHGFLSQLAEINRNTRQSFRVFLFIFIFSWQPVRDMFRNSDFDCRVNMVVCKQVVNEVI